MDYLPKAFSNFIFISTWFASSAFETVHERDKMYSGCVSTNTVYAHRVTLTSFTEGLCQMRIAKWERICARREHWNKLLLRSITRRGLNMVCFSQVEHRPRYTHCKQRCMMIHVFWPIFNCRFPQSLERCWNIRQAGKRFLCSAYFSINANLVHIQSSYLSCFGWDSCWWWGNCAIIFDW